jgi:hypothetical protein
MWVMPVKSGHYERIKDTEEDGKLWTWSVSAVLQALNMCNYYLDIVAYYSLAQFCDFRLDIAIPTQVFHETSTPLKVSLVIQ